MSRGASRIFIRNLELAARIGIYGHEQGTTQPVRVNVTMDVATSPAEDRLECTVDYEAVSTKIRAIIAEGHINLAETLAERIADACLEDGRVSRAVVRVEKLHALKGAEAAGVEIERGR